MLIKRWQYLSRREQRLLKLVATLVIAWGLGSLIRPGWQQWLVQEQQQTLVQQQLELLHTHLPYINRQSPPEFLRGADTLQAQLERTLSHNGLPVSVLQRNGALWQIQLRDIDEPTLWNWFDQLAYCQGVLTHIDLRQRSPGRLDLSLQMTAWREG